MRIRDIVYMSVGYTLRQKRRLIPVFFGIALGVALLVSIVTAAATISQTTTQQILGQNSLKQITVSGNNLQDEQLEKFRHLPHVTAVYPVYNIDLAASTTNQQQFILSVTNTPSQQDLPPLLEGHWPGQNQVVLPDSVLNGKTSALIKGSTLMNQKLSLRIASLQGLGRVTMVTVTVVGVYHATPTDNPVMIFPTYSTLNTVKHLGALNSDTKDASFDAQLTYQSAVVDIDDPSHVTQIGNLLDKQGYYTNYVEKELKGLSLRLEAITTISLAIVSVIIVVVALSISNLLISSVRQRRREIGIMLAIGFSERAIGKIIAGEAISISIIGSVCGCLLALLGLVAFHMLQPSITISFPWWGVPAAIGVNTALCFLAGLSPARKAMKMDVVQTLRED
jgi:ABC-type lipoprotein release transport system permease subunit